MSTDATSPTAPTPVPAKKRFGFFKKILLLFAVIVVVFVAIVAMQPPEFRIARSANVAAPPAAVFEHVNDFRHWEHWSPWAKLDPTMKVTYDGPATGKGATYTWVGNDEVGEGKMTILDSVPNESITIRLDFVRPFPSSNTVEFTFKPEASGTSVTWTMHGRNNFLSKAFHLVMNVDKLVGGDFEKGLASLKDRVEAKK